MIRILAFAVAGIIVVSGAALAASVASGQQPGAPVSAQTSDPYYCPPGAKFCPVPGKDNTVYIDTHFGMDAATGKITRYKDGARPAEPVNNLTTREEVLYTAPPINVANRQVPYPGSPSATQPQAYPAPQQYRAQPVIAAAPAGAMQQPYQAPQTVVQAPNYVTPQRTSPLRASEVADQQPVRPVTIEEPKKNDSKIPWWKGGMWRNKKSDDDDPPKRSSSSSRTDATSAPPVTPDDMWGDEDEYTGYNTDGSFNQQPAVAGSFADPYADPFAAPQTQTQPYAQPPVATGGTMYAGDPYTLPNSPPPTSPYQPGYTYPGSDVTYDNTFQGGYPQTGAPPATYQSGPYMAPNTTAYTAAPTYQSDPFGGQPVTTYQDPFSGQPVTTYQDPFGGQSVATTYQSDPYATSTYTPPPASAPWETNQPLSGFGGMTEAPAAAPAAPPAAAPPASGSAQFQNAVQMVKDQRFGEAKSILLGETTADPNNAAVWRWLGDTQYNLLELQDAIDTYQNALRLDPNDYYAMRGQGFAHLHRGHELWRRMMEELKLGQREQAAATFSQAHENYKRSLEKLGDCLRRAPNDEEAVYGEAMAAEGASRKLYSNAISYVKLGPENRERAELFAENCLQVINKGVERSAERARTKPGESGPRALLGGLYLRKAMLYHQLGKQELALAELKNSYSVQKSILDEIDKNNLTAQKGVKDCETYWTEWGGTGQL